MTIGPIVGAGIKVAKPVVKKVAKSLEKQIDDLTAKIDDLRVQWKKAPDKKAAEKIAQQGAKAKESLRKLQDKLQKKIEESGRVDNKTGRTNNRSRGAADEKLSDSTRGVRRPKSSATQLESQLKSLRKQWTTLNNQLKKSVTKSQRDSIIARKEKLTKMGQQIQKELRELNAKNSTK